MTDTHDMPGHLARRFQQIAVAVFLAEVEGAGYDLTPVQYVALAAIDANPGIDQVTLAGLIAYDRTTITGVIDRLVQKGLVARQESSRDRRARELKITDAGRRTYRAITPAVEAAQQIMMRGLTEK
jgi:DNA-binding MarR family transcriptional regulator